MSDMFGKSASARTELHLRLVDLLRELDLSPGDPLPGEVELAHRLAVSRPQLREALRMLEALGVVHSRQGARRTWLGFSTSVFAQQLAITLGPTARSVAELLEIRQALETSLLPRAIVLIDADRLAQLEVLADRMVDLATSGKPFTREDQQFHSLLLAPLENELLDGLLSTFWSVFGDFAENHPTEEDPVPVAQMHGRIVRAIRNRDARLAVHEMDAHFYGVRARLAADGDTNLGSTTVPTAILT